MLRYFFLILMLLHPVYNGDISVNKVQSVAVVPFQVWGDIKQSKIFSHGLPDAISHRLSRVDNLIVLERIKLGEILQEIKLQECGLIPDADLNKIGKLLKADIIITAIIHKVSKGIRFQLSGIQVSSGEILFSILKYFTPDEFYDFSNLEYTISRSIVKAIRPDCNINTIIKDKISGRSLDSIRMYAKGLYYLDRGENDKSKQCFLISTRDESDDFWVEQVRREADKMFRELNQED